jgi:hypothetical protein
VLSVYGWSVFGQAFLQSLAVILADTLVILALWGRFCRFALHLGRKDALKRAREIRQNFKKSGSV